MRLELARQDGDIHLRYTSPEGNIVVEVVNVKELSDRWVELEAFWEETEWREVE